MIIVLVTFVITLFNMELDIDDMLLGLQREGEINTK